MSSESLVQLARKIATEAHAGQFRRCGIVPYIVHPEMVAGRVGDDLDAQVVAWLHDVIEDSSQTPQSLIDAGIPAHLVETVVLMTKTQDTDYEAYLEKIAGSALATKVKIADMLSNLSDSPSPKQIQKYAKGLLRLAR
ncbi:hypothetical protein EI77_01277 [Prosthecobacter fusiformis]|uniref:HD domain-containing protein n=1 Tax=Prosthecobacter fusiformis TaxID=48464 RepID=A0A4R7S356_9BACT|nr:GTP pyrophosphokinase [Prosthecobacter fusiformis]TDU72812.1 hypothetical protein EI77_01277 [Prosthecobacter fusiformis]